MEAELEALLAQLENVSTDDETPNPSPRMPSPTGPYSTPMVAQLVAPQVSTIQVASVQSVPITTQSQGGQGMYAKPSTQTPVVAVPHRATLTEVPVTNKRPLSTRKDPDEDLTSLLSTFKASVTPQTAPSGPRQSASTTTNNNTTPSLKTEQGSWEGNVYRSPYEEEFLRAQRAAGEEQAARELAEKEMKRKEEEEKARRKIEVDRAAGCGRCGLSVSGSYLQALGREWHSTCFVCDSCTGALTGPTARGGGQFYELRGRPHCEPCYRRLTKGK